MVCKRFLKKIYIFSACTSILILGCEEVHETNETSLPTITAEVIVVEQHTNISGSAFFTCVTDLHSYKGRNDDLISGSLIMNEWPTELPWRYGSPHEKELLFNGLFSEKRTHLAWSKDLRKGFLFKGFSGLFGGHNQLYIDNATDDIVKVTLGGVQFSDLNPHSHGRVMLTPGTYLLVAEKINKDGPELIDNINILIEHAGKSDPYFYNISRINNYAFKYKTYTRL